jgi:hypothetical protein
MALPAAIASAVARSSVRLSWASSAVLIPTRHPVASLTVICLAWFTTLSFVASLTPNGIVFGDEAGYLLPTLFGADAHNYQRWEILPGYPSYLYFWTYSFLPLANLHAASKLLNAVFIIATAPIAYMVTRRYASATVALVFAVLVITTPISSFVRYVMPEPMYLFGFWLIVLVVTWGSESSFLLSGLSGGTLIGVLSLVKPHALALAVGVAIFYLVRERFRSRGIAAALLTFCAFYCAHLILGWLLTGKWLLSLSGSWYAALLSGRWIDVSAVLENLIGHLSAIAVLAAVPIALTFAFSIRAVIGKGPPTGETEIRRLHDLALLACCLIVAMLAMTVYFSQSIYQLSPETERITRLHGRFYGYVIPLFVLVTIGLWWNGTEIWKLLPRQAFLLLFAAMALGAIVVVSKFEVETVDFSELTLFNSRRSGPALLLIASVLGVGLYPFFDRRTAYLPMLGVAWWIGLSAVTSTALIVIAPLSHALSLKEPVDTAFFDPLDRTGLASLVGRDDGLIAGTPSSAVDVFRTMFYLRSLGPGKIVSTGRVLTDKDFPSVAWAVLLQGVRYSGSAEVRRHGEMAVVFFTH